MITGIEVTLDGRKIELYNPVVAKYTTTAVTLIDYKFTTATIVLANTYFGSISVMFAYNYSLTKFNITKR